MSAAIFRALRRTTLGALFLGVFVVVALQTIPAHAAPGINQQLNFQGRLLTSSGATVADGYYNMQFKIYQDGTGTAAGNPSGTLKWTESWLNSSSAGVQVKNGYMSVQLGSITSLSSVDWNQDTLWLSIDVGSTDTLCTPFTSCGGDGEMLPMKRLSSTPYAFNAGKLGGLSSAEFLQLAKGVQADTSNSTSSIAINKTGSGGNFLQFQSSSTDVFTVSNTGNLSLGNNVNHTISVATATAGTAGKSLTLSAGTAGTGASALSGGDLVLQGGTGGGTSGNGGNLTLDAGAAASGGVSGSISIGATNASGVTIGKASSTTTIQGNLAVTLNGTAGLTITCSNASNYLSVCDSSVLTPSAANFIQNQNTAVQTAANYWISGTARSDTSTLTPLVDAATAVALGIGTTNATAITVGKAGVTTTVQGNLRSANLDTPTSGVLSIGTTNATQIALGQNTVLAANKSLTITGGTTASRPATPTEGMMWYDTTTKQLLTYANGKWQADRSTSTKIVAASNASQALKDGADYVATGTGDQTIINTALTAAAGGKVYLTEGTFTINGSISIPNNTMLAGAGAGTIITIPNAFEFDGFYGITNVTSGGSGAGITIQDLRIDGNKANQDLGGGSAWGIMLDGVGTETNSTAAQGCNITNVWATDWVGSGIGISSSANCVISDNTLLRNLIGISAYGSANVTMAGNVAQENRNAGIDVSSGANITATGNTIVTDISVGALGIYFSSISQGTISANTLSGNGISIGGSSKIVISANSITDSGGASTNNAIYLNNSSNNIITGNQIEDSSASVHNHAITIYQLGSSDNYIANNTLGGGDISNTGTGTIYGGQVSASNNYVIQPAGTIELMKSTNVTGTLSASTSLLAPSVDRASAGTLTIGTNATNTTALTIGSSAVTTTIQGNTGVTLNATTGTTMVCHNASGVLSMCDAGYLTPTSTNFIQNGTTQQASSNFNISGTGVATTLQAATSVLTPLVDTATAVALNIGTTNATVINLNENVTVAAGKSLTLAGGTTANRPATPTEGMLWYDTTTKQLLTYANGKWQADRTTSTKIVAASNSSQTAKDSADYVATGTGDQTIINTALAAAAGGKVYLTEGTYTVSATISIPNNTTLAGAGAGTLITVPNGLGTSLNAITNTDTTTGTGVTIQDLRLDGNKANQSGAAMNGIYLTGVGSGSGSSALTGSKVTGVHANNWYTNYGIYISSGSNSVITNNTVRGNDNYGIYLNSVTNSTFSGNNAQGNSNGFRLQSVYSDTITGNTAQGNTYYGIYLNISHDNTVTANIAQLNNSNGIILSMSYDNTISSNSLYNNGGTTTNNGIYLDASDGNVITSNVITDTSATTNNYAINIYNSTSDTNYLADNTLGGGSINNAGTGTIYGGQTSSTGNFLIQPAGTIELMKNTNVTGTLSASTSLLAPSVDRASTGTLTIGTNATNTTALTVGSASVTTTIAGNTGVTLNATTGTTMVCRNASGVLSACDAGYLTPTTTNFIQNQNAAAQTTANFWISGTGQATTLTAGTVNATTNLVTPTIDTSSATALTLGGTTASSVDVGRSAGTINLKANSTLVGTAAATGNITVQGAAQTVAATAGNQFILKGSTGNTTGVGGQLTLQGGDAGSTSGTNGGNVYIAGGAGTGTGVSGLVVMTTPTFLTASADANCYTGGANVAASCTVSSASVNGSSAVLVGFSTDSQTAILPDPTIATAGRVVYVTASTTSQDFTLYVNGGGQGNQIAMRKNTTATMIWNGTDWTAAGASSSTTLQASYDNTLQSAGGAELVVSKTSATNGLTIRDSTTNSVNGALLTVQSSSAANLFSVNSTVTEYTSNSGAETYNGTTTTFPASTWSALTGSTVTRNVTTGNIATGQGSAQVVTATTAGSGVKNTLNTSLTAGQHYNVSFTAKLSSGTFTDLAVYYSIDGTADSVTCILNQAIKTSVWTKINCTFTAPSSGITAANSLNIRQTASGTIRTFFVDNASVTIAADYNYATDGTVNDNTNFPTNWTTTGTGSTVTRNTDDGQQASDSAQAVITAGGTNRGVRNKLSINPLSSTLYLVTAYAKQTTGAAFNDFAIRYSRDGGTNFVDCVDYNTRVVSASWSQITCYIQTDGTAPSGSGPYVYFVASASSARTFLVDTFSMTLASSSTPNVQVGGGVNGGPTTLFTLDKGASAPIASNNDALLGSMYYDTTLDKLQCYEADGWGACGSSPDTVVTISPEFNNAVLHGTGIGTMTSDICSDTLNINDSGTGTTICGTNETYNFYKWTSPQASPQAYSIYVTYQLPSTFKEFASGQASLMGRTDSANSSVTYQIFRSDVDGLTACSAAVSVSTGVQTTWQTKIASGGADPSTCSFEPSDSIVFKIEMTASGTANAYVSNLNFIFSNR